MGVFRLSPARNSTVAQATGDSSASPIPAEIALVLLVHGSRYLTETSCVPQPTQMDTQAEVMYGNKRRSRMVIISGTS